MRTEKEPPAHLRGRLFVVTMEKRKSICREGTELLRIRISLPKSNIESVDAFYEEIGRRAETFCRARLAPYAESIYGNDPDPRRHVRFAPLCYRLRGVVSYQSECLLSVRIEASLCRGNRELHRFADAHNFLLPDGLLLAPRDALSRYWAKKVTRRQAKGIRILLLTDVAPYEWHDGEWRERKLAEQSI